MVVSCFFLFTSISKIIIYCIPYKRACQDSIRGFAIPETVLPFSVDPNQFFTHFNLIRKPGSLNSPELMIFVVDNFMNIYDNRNGKWII